MDQYPRIDQIEPFTKKISLTVDPIPSYPGLFIYDGNPFFTDSVEQGRFADIRPSHQSYFKHAESDTSGAIYFNRISGGKRGLGRFFLT